MKTIENWLDTRPQLEILIGYSFRDKTLLQTAFTHRSFANEHRISATHNERLEFLGDSVLGLLVADYLYKKYPFTPEGELSAFRARLVEASACAGYVQTLEISPFLLLGKGELLNQGRGRDSILADLFEALIGAIYLDGGMEAALSFFFNSLTQELETLLGQPMANWKAALQDACQKRFHKTPGYIVLEMTGPDHERLFKIAAMLGEDEIGTGTGPSKKVAEQSAAKDALDRIKAKENQKW